MSTKNAIELVSLAQGEGPKVWSFGFETYLKATGNQTAGALGLIEQYGEVGMGSPYHVHHGEDEIFFVLEGELTFISGDSRFTGTAGSYTYLPRDIPHGFKVTGDRPARFFILVTPAGFEQFMLEMSEPTPPAGPPNIDKAIATAAKYNIDILGPLPE